MAEPNKNERFEEAISHAASEFISREANRTSLITVTGISLSEKGSHATIGISVLPKDGEEAALTFLRRKRTDFREYLKEMYPARNIPMVDFMIDLGEKNRERIDELLKEGDSSAT